MSFLFGRWHMNVSAHTHTYTLSLSLCPSPSLSLSRSFSPSPCLSLSLWSPCCQFCFCRVLYYTVLHSFSTESNSTEGDPGVSSPSVPALVYVPTHNTHACTHTRTHTRTHTVLTRTLALQLHIHQVFFLQWIIATTCFSCCTTVADISLNLHYSILMKIKHCLKVNQVKNITRRSRKERPVPLHVS